MFFIYLTYSKVQNVSECVRFSSNKHFIGANIEHWPWIHFFNLQVLEELPRPWTWTYSSESVAVPHSALIEAAERAGDDPADLY